MIQNSIGVFRSGVVVDDPTLPIFTRDPLTDNLTGGAVKFIFDMLRDFQISHAATNYSPGDAIDDLTILDHNARGEFYVKSPPQVVTSNSLYGGADFSSITAKGVSINAPSEVLDDIYANGQYFAVSVFGVLPEKSDWNTAATILPIFATATTAHYPSGADMMTIAQQQNYNLSFRRQTNGSTQTSLTITIQDDAFGKPFMLMYARTSTGTIARLKTPDTDQRVTGAKGDDNAADFTVGHPQIGILDAFGTALSNTAKMTIFRSWLIDMSNAGMTPDQIFDADFSRVFERIGHLTP